MEITQQADYAVRAVLELALGTEGERIFSKEIAARQDIPPAFLTKILARLSAEGIVSTRRGRNGGIRLTRPPSEISILQVVEAIDGPIALNRCVRQPSECPRDAFCLVHGVWCMVQAELRARLGAITFESLSQGEYALPDSDSEELHAFA